MRSVEQGGGTRILGRLAYRVDHEIERFPGGADGSSVRCSSWAMPTRTGVSFGVAHESTVICGRTRWRDDTPKVRVAWRRGALCD